MEDVRPTALFGGTDITTIIISLAFLAALYVVLSPRFNYGLYRPLMFHPYPFVPGTEQPPAFENCQAQEIFFPRSAKGNLCGWYFKLAGAEQVFLFSHGNAGNIGGRSAMIELQLLSGGLSFRLRLLRVRKERRIANAGRHLRRWAGSLRLSDQ